MDSHHKYNELSKIAMAILKKLAEAHFAVKKLKKTKKSKKEEVKYCKKAAKKGTEEKQNDLAHAKEALNKTNELLDRASAYCNAVVEKLKIIQKKMIAILEEKILGHMSKHGIGWQKLGTKKLNGSLMLSVKSAMKEESECHPHITLFTLMGIYDYGPNDMQALREIFQMWMALLPNALKKAEGKLKFTLEGKKQACLVPCDDSGEKKSHLVYYLNLGLSKAIEIRKKHGVSWAIGQPPSKHLHVSKVDAPKDVLALTKIVWYSG